MKKCNYITIEREYGSGGTEIARRLAEECEISCYGREIMEAVAEKYEIPISRIERYEETVSSSFLYTIFVMSRVQSGDNDMLMKEGHIHVAEQREIQRLAANGPAVFLGHCAFEALKDYRGVVRVFIRAEEKEKKKRILEEYGIQESEMENVRKWYDRKRANYYYANTARKWDDLKNYDLVLNSSQLGIDGCVAVLKGLLER